MNKGWIPFLLRVVIVFIILEVAARVDNYIEFNANVLSPYTRELTILQVDEFGETGKPNTRFKKWRINNVGFRGNDINLRLPAPAFRVMALGASETFGIYEDEGFEWPAQLLKRLQNRVTGFDLINASFGGTGYVFAKLVKRFERTLLSKFKPNVLLIYSTPMSYLYKLKESNTVYTPTLVDHIRLHSKIRDVYRKFVPQSVIDFKDRALLLLKKEATVPVEMRSLEEAKRLLQEDITKLAHICKKNNVLLVLSSHVQREDPFAMLLHHFWSPNLSDADIVKYHAELNSVVRVSAQKHGVLFIDMNNRLKGIDSNFADPFHLTNEGARIVADEFYSVIKEKHGL